MICFRCARQDCHRLPDNDHYCGDFVKARWARYVTENTLARIGVGGLRSHATKV